MELTTITTVWNAARFLPALLDSLQRQTVRPQQWIIVDDGSTDGTGRLIARWLAENPWICLLQPGRIGRGRALNEAWRAADTPLIMNVDADDLLSPRHVETLLRLFEAMPDLAVVGGRSLQVKGDEAPTWPDGESDETIDVTRGVRRRNPICHSGAVLSGAWLQRVGGYDERRRSQFDYDLWVRIAEAGGRLARCERVTIAHRVHSAQAFEASRRVRYLLASLQVQRRALRCVPGPPLDWFYLPLRFAWGLLPRCARLATRAATRQVVR